MGSPKFFSHIATMKATGVTALTLTFSLFFFQNCGLPKDQTEEQATSHSTESNKSKRSPGVAIGDESWRIPGIVGSTDPNVRVIGSTGGGGGDSGAGGGGLGSNSNPDLTGLPGSGSCKIGIKTDSDLLAPTTMTLDQCRAQCTQKGTTNPARVCLFEGRDIGPREICNMTGGNGYQYLNASFSAQLCRTTCKQVSAYDIMVTCLWSTEDLSPTANCQGTYKMPIISGGLIGIEWREFPLFSTPDLTRRQCRSLCDTNPLPPDKRGATRGSCSWQNQIRI